ncbi:MAG: hypothetical protein ACYTGR_06625 [Planctomycetota bacterium]
MAPRSAEHYRRRLESATEQTHVPLPRDRHQILRGEGSEEVMEMIVRFVDGVSAPTVS